MLSGGVWQDSGVAVSSVGSSAANRVGWMLAENACHSEVVAPATNPYTSPPTPGVLDTFDIALDLFADAVAQHIHVNNNGPTPIPGLTHEPRSADPSQQTPRAG